MIIIIIIIIIVIIIYIIIRPWWAYIYLVVVADGWMVGMEIVIIIILGCFEVMWCDLLSRSVVSRSVVAI